MNEHNQPQSNEILKLYIRRAKIVNGVFLVLFIIAAVLAAIEKTSFAGFIVCCVLSLAWTIVYCLLAHQKLYKIDRKYAYIFIAIAAVICGITFFCLYINAKPQLSVLVNGSATWNDIIPFIIAIKGLADVGIAFNKSLKTN